MFDIIAAMGRLRIKKKEAVIPFRSTVAYRLLLSTGSVILLIFALYQLVSAIRARNTTLLTISAMMSAMAAMAVFYNLGQVRNARIPERTLKRMGRK
jgi:hypothetical protein